MRASTDLSPRPPTRASRGGWGDALLVGLAAVIVARLAVYRLRNYPFPLDLGAAMSGAATTAEATVPAALATWLVVTVTVVALAGWLRRIDPRLHGSEAAVGAVVLFWAAAYVTLLTLGPIGWYQPAVLRAGLAAAVLATFRFPRLHRPRWPLGARIAALAIALSVVPLLLLQIGSPVSPFMDVLPLVAPVQKIVTFRFYDPFANDATGLVALGRGAVGYDAPLSFLALVAGVPAHLAISSLIVPCAVLQIVAFYLIGRNVNGSLAGGMATLFLLQTFVWRRTMDIRGTCLAFALIVIGIGFLVGLRRSPTRTVLGGLALGVAVVVNPLIGAFGMGVAALAIVIAWIDLRRPLIAPLAALAAASVFALPQVVIGLGRQVPTWVLPLVAALGVLLMLVVGRVGVGSQRRQGRSLPLGRLLVILGLPIAVLLLHARRQSEFFNDDWFGYGILALLAAGGFAACASAVWRQPARWPAAGVPALALALAMAIHVFASPHRFAGTLEVRSLASEVTTKVMYYWSPYWMALAAGVWFGALARRWAFAPAAALALLLVVYPVRQVHEAQDYDSSQHSLAETWGFHLANAARGYHAGRPDRRWVLDAEWRDLADLLLAEVAAGRIGYHTHVLQIAQSINEVELALGTGISVDLVAPQGNDPGNIWLVGTRVRGLDAVPEAFARRPRYVLLQRYPASQFPELAAYEELMGRSGFQLYRLRESGGAPPPS